MSAVSIIIPTYNGAHKLPFVLESLTKQNFTDFEVVIAVDGSKDNTLEVLDGYKNRFASFRVVVGENSGRAKIRNAGAKEASNELLIFYDDDMMPSENSVQRHVAALMESPCQIITGNAIEYVEANKTDLQNYKALLTHKWVEPFSNSVNHLTFETLFLTAANCATSKTTFNLLNGFDERLTDAEDFDLAYRSLEKQIPVVFDKENIAVHRDFITPHTYAKRLRDYAQAHKQIEQLHPKQKRFLSKSSLGGKRWIYKMLSWPLFLSLINNSLLVRTVPQKIRYRLYDAIFHAQVLFVKKY